MIDHVTVQQTPPETYIQKARQTETKVRKKDGI